LVTLFGTMYAVRYLRRKGFIKRPPKSATMSELVQTQRKIVQHRLRKRTQLVKEQYHKRIGKKEKKQINGKRRNGHNHNEDLTKSSTSIKHLHNRRQGHTDETSRKKPDVLESGVKEKPAGTGKHNNTSTNKDYDTDAAKKKLTETTKVSKTDKDFGTGSSKNSGSEVH